MTPMDWILLTVSLSVLAGYHCWFLMRLKRAPLSTSFGFYNATRVNWVKAVMQRGQDVLAIQTLRNWIMAASFLASTGIIIGLGILNAALNPDFFGNAQPLLSLAGETRPGGFEAKLMVLGVVFFTAFFNFTLAIRNYIHVGYLINIPREYDPNITPALVAATLNQGAGHYTIGMRAFYISIPLTLWLFGEIWFLAGTVTLVLLLLRLDRATRG